MIVSEAPGSDAHAVREGLRRVLVVAYYFPPMGLSGVQRVAKFVKYLPAHGWHPTVLTVEPAGYFAFDAALLEEVEAAGVHVVRTSSLDPTRLFGRTHTVALPAEPARRWMSTLSQLLFVPDNKIGWLLPAVRAGKRLLRAAPFEVILSTAPPYTAHLVGLWLSRHSGVPLVADYRDDWVGNPRHVYPTALHERLNRRLERAVVGQSRHSVTINRYIREGLLARNAGAARAGDVSVLPQGFDPDDFTRAPVIAPSDRMRLVYTGIFYDAQTPDYFLRALADLLGRQPGLRARIEAVFVGLVPEASHRLAEALGLADVVRYVGYRPHLETVGFLRAAQVLWMTIGERPGAEGISTGKLYEYFGARKPILALVPVGAARETLAGYGAARVVPPADVPAIRDALAWCIDRWEAGTLPTPSDAFVDQYDRRRLAGRLAGILAQCARRT
jgi:glycosyltransferase involved in cell wall biosynthesis